MSPNIETFDRDAQRRRYSRLYYHRALTIRYLIECVNDFTRREGDQALAFLDDHYTAPEGRKEFIHYKSQGTFGYKSSKRLHIDELDFCDSRSMLGLQAADLCTYAYQRTVTARDADPRAVALQKQPVASLRHRKQGSAKNLARPPLTPEARNPRTWRGSGDVELSTEDNLYTPGFSHPADTWSIPHAQFRTTDDVDYQHLHARFPTRALPLNALHFPSKSG